MLKINPPFWFSLKFRIVFNDVFNLMQSRITMSKEKFDACKKYMNLDFKIVSLTEQASKSRVGETNS
jgi:hypothetical protein